MKIWIFQRSYAVELLRGLGVNQVKASSISKVRKEVARSFPEMAGVKPSVRKQENHRIEGEQYMLTFKGKADLPGGRKMSRVVRVVADERGRIIKMSTSK